MIQPLLFQLPPERAQRLADLALGLWPLWRVAEAVIGFKSEALRTEVAGIPLANPIGLAAGYDKNCALLPALTSLGFGYVTCGTVTREARSGNPGTRLLRDTSRDAVINSLGFPGKGLDAAAERLARDQDRLSGAPVVVSVSGTDIDDIVTCHRRLETLAQAVEINIGSPNTAGIRVFHDPDVLRELLRAVTERRSAPIFVKMPPFPARHENPGRHDLALELAEVCASNGVDALTVANSRPVADSRLATGAGGLSGRPLLGRMLEMVSEVRARVGRSTAINACGGVFCAEDAWLALAAGADTVQVLTGFFYRGPGVARDISKGLAVIVERSGLDSVRSLN